MFLTWGYPRPGCKRPPNRNRSPGTTVAVYGVAPRQESHVSRHRRDAMGIKVKVCHNWAHGRFGNAEAQTLYSVDIGDTFQDASFTTRSARRPPPCHRRVRKVGQLAFYQQSPVRHFRLPDSRSVGDTEYWKGQSSFVDIASADGPRRQCARRNSSERFAVHTFRVAVRSKYIFGW